MSFRKSHPLIKIANNSLVDLKAPINLTYFWNGGSLLGLVLVIQLVSGIILVTRFSSDTLLAFDSVISLYQDVNYGWLLRLVHSTGASFFFVLLYGHIGRGLYYGSFTKSILWNTGALIYLLVMGTAFLGYVLPWGQMSFWAATVITNLLSAIPYIGAPLVEWVWGGFSVGNPTLTRFFALHYLLPFIITALVVVHVFYLHWYGSSNPLGVKSTGNKVYFHYYFSVKDLMGIFIFLLVFLVFTLKFGYYFMDAENFIPANSLVTPIHIQPEWYFLFAYAILRSIPSKLGGVVALLLSVVILFLYSVNSENILVSGFYRNSLLENLYFSFVLCFSILTWLGMCAAEAPYLGLAQGFTILYFVLHFLMIFSNHWLSKNYLVN